MRRAGYNDPTLLSESVATYLTIAIGPRASWFESAQAEQLRNRADRTILQRARMAHYRALGKTKTTQAN